MRLQHSQNPSTEKSIRTKCRNYDPEFKKKVALFAENKGNQEAKRRFGVSESNIRRWKKIQKEHVIEKVAFRKASIKKKTRRRKVIVEDIPNKIDSMPLEQRLKSPILPSTSEQEQVLHSHPLSPTKLKVTRQTKPKELSPKPISPPPVEEICLKWNSHHGNMQSMFPALLLKEQYVDATLVAEGQTLKCHRMILSSCSPYFEEVLSNISPYQHPVLFMKDVPFWILKSLCDFMYSGEVLIMQDKLTELLSAAENLKIKGLTGKPDVSNDDVLKGHLYKQIKEEQKDDLINEKEFDKKDITRDKRRHHTSAVTPNIIPEQTPPKNSKSQKTNDTPSVKTSKIPKLNPYSDNSAVKSTNSKISKLHTSHLEPSPLKAISSKVLRSSSSTRKIEKSDKVLIKEPISKGDILDPFDLLEPVYEEVQNEPVIPNKVKDTSKSVSIKKTVQKKVKKRKISDDRDESPPPILSRKGTRSRPNKKIPRFYHSGFDNSAPKIQESTDTTIVREPHTSQAESQELSQSNQAELHDDQVEIHSEHAESNMEQADPLFQLTDIKAEPFDADDSTIEIEHNVVDFDEPVTSMNEDLLEENYESVLDFVEKNVPEKKGDVKTPFKKIRVKRQQGLLDVEKTNMVKIVDVDKIKVSAEILEEDPLTLTSSLDSNIKIMTVETINENINDNITENKDSLSGSSDATFKICTLTENSEPSKETEENSLGFEIASVVTETEPDKDVDEQEELIPVCQIAEVFSETEVIKNKIVECKSRSEDSLDGANSDISSANLRKEDAPESFEGFSISANVEDSESLRSSKNNLNEISKRGVTDDIDDEVCKSSDNLKEAGNVTEVTTEHKETDESSIDHSETSDVIERANAQLEVSYIPEKSVLDLHKTSDDESKDTDCFNQGRDALNEVVEELSTTGKLIKIDDVFNKDVESIDENIDDLSEVVNDPKVIEIDTSSKDVDTVVIESEYLEEYPNTCVENNRSTDKVTCLQKIYSNKDMGSDKNIEFHEPTHSNSVEPTSSLEETVGRHTIPNEQSTNEDIDMSSEDNHTKDPVLANAIPYTNEDLPEASRQNEALPMEVCEESLSQGTSTFDQTSNTFELVTDVPPSTFGTPGFHIAQVISEQIALNEECRFTNQPMDTSFEGSMTGSNELEMIVNDLTKIVGESQRLDSNMEHEDIAESLENLLEK